MVRLLQPVSAGQPITAAWANEILSELRRLRRIAAASPLQVTQNEAGVQISLAGSLTQIDLVELTEDIEAHGSDQTANLLAYDSQAAGDPWYDSGRDIESVTDLQGGLHLAGERKVAVFHAGAGKATLWPAVQFHLGQADAYVSPGQSGTVSIWEVDGSSHADSGKNVTAFDWLGRGLAAGPVYVFQHLQDPRRWYAIGVTKARKIRFTLDAALATSSASAAATVLHSADGISPGSTVTVYNQPVGSAHVFEGASGATGLAYYDPENDKYWIEWVVCL